MTAGDTPTLPPSQPRISDFVAWWAERTPDAEAMVLDGARTSYAAFNAQIDALAKALLAAGVGKGDRVATLCPPSPDYFVAFLASASIGAIWLGLNPRYQLDELSYVVGDSEPVVLLARSQIGKRDYRADLAALVKAAPSVRAVAIVDAQDGAGVDGAVGLESFLATGAEVCDAALATARANCGGRDPCMIVYTSGSTGRPKGALLHHEGIAEFSLGQNRVWPVNPLRVLNYFPINHVGCVIDVSCPALVAGGAIVFLEHFDPARSLELMQAEKVTLWGSVPSVFQLQFALPDFADYDLSAVKTIMWGGAAMPRETIARLLDYGLPLATNYGLTESSSAITVIPPTRDIDILSTTVGWPFEGTEIRLVDRQGREVADGEEGELHSRSRYNMLGYWRRPEATAEVLLEGGWMATGDIARKNPDGSYSIRGRVKEMYKSGGYNVYPREVENAIEAHDAVEMAAVVSVPDPVWQEVGVAYVLPGAPVTAEALAAHCRERLANYKLPKLFVIVDDLPLLPIGKVDKVTLKKRAADVYQPEGNVAS